MRIYIFPSILSESLTFSSIVDGAFIFIFFPQYSPTLIFAWKIAFDKSTKTLSTLFYMLFSSLTILFSILSLSIVFIILIKICLQVFFFCHSSLYPLGIKIWYMYSPFLGITQYIFNWYFIELVFLALWMTVFLMFFPLDSSQSSHGSCSCILRYVSIFYCCLEVTWSSSQTHGYNPQKLLLRCWGHPGNFSFCLPSYSVLLFPFAVFSFLLLGLFGCSFSGFFEFLVYPQLFLFKVS